MMGMERKEKKSMTIEQKNKKNKTNERMKMTRHGFFFFF